MSCFGFRERTRWARSCRRNSDSEIRHVQYTDGVLHMRGSGCGREQRMGCVAPLAGGPFPFPRDLGLLG